MNISSLKKKNVYLDKINENLAGFFRSLEKFHQVFDELSQVINGTTVHINDIQRILGQDEDDDHEDHRSVLDDDDDGEQREAMAAEKLCELNENLNLSVREIRQTWNMLEKQGGSISKTVNQTPKMIRLFLDTTKTDVDFNDPYFRSEMSQLSDQFPIIGKFYYELCLELQVNLLDLSNMKAIKHIASILDFLSSRSTSISVPIQIIRQIQAKLC